MDPSSTMQLGEGASSNRYPLGPAPLNRGDEEGEERAHKPPRGVMCPGAEWMRMDGPCGRLGSGDEETVREDKREHGSTYPCPG